MGELKIVENADWNIEIGALSVLSSKHIENTPALLFDRIKDYPAGYRILVGFFESLRRSALTTNLPVDITREGFIEACRRRLATNFSIPPVTVSRGPILENVYQGDDIDLFKFPVPFWHKRDGGRYIGTGHVIITRDPDDGWVNVGCYRVMVYDCNTLGMNISPGKHGRMHRAKYFEKGKPCPVVACFGVDPLLHMIATRPEPYGKCEFDAVGGIKGEPVEVIEGEITGLPIPAYAEIAVDAEILPDQGKEEGPFSEWTGYYASGEKTEPVIKSPPSLSSQRSNHHRLAGVSPHRAGRALLRIAARRIHSGPGGKSRRAGRERRRKLLPSLLNRHLDQAALPRSCAPGCTCRQSMPGRRPSRPLHRRRGRRYRCL